jgi:hypothetical protein
LSHIIPDRGYFGTSEPDDELSSQDRSPRRYAYREASLDDMRTVYRKLLVRKSNSLLWANILFGLGLAAFAALIVFMLWARF